MTQTELKQLIEANETFRVEFTRSVTDTDKFREAICSFSNDLSGDNFLGYLIIGFAEDDPNFRLKITDKLLQQFASYRSDGAILPQPIMKVFTINHPHGNGEVLVVQVTPHDLPPVRYKGRTCIRIGPRKDYATPSEERILIERRNAHFPTFDATPCPEGSTERLDQMAFTQTYRPTAIAREIIEENGRDIKEQLAALRFYNLTRDCPTNAGMLVFADDPLDLFPGAVIQYVQFDGLGIDAEPLAEKRFTGNLLTILSELDTFLKGRFTQRPIEISTLQEKLIYDFPPNAVRELLMNAVLHRDYQSTSPIRLYQFDNRIEIQNPGGLYGDATPENFPRVNSYRNPILAEVMHNLGYVNRFGRGVAKAKKALLENGSAEPIFQFEPNHFLATIPKHPDR